MSNLRAAIAILFVSACSSSAIDVGSNQGEGGASDGGQNQVSYVLSTPVCSDMTAQVLAMLRASCGFCHSINGGGGEQGNFGFVLDPDRMVLERVRTPLFGPGARFLVPGMPEGSVIYQRITHNHPYRDEDSDAAPPTTFTYPTPSDASLLYGWILTCFGPDPLFQAAD